MKTLVIQKNRNLLLAGIIAFMILLATQISVQAYTYAGGFRNPITVGGVGVQWLNIGSSIIDADINVGEMPAVVTGAVTASGNQATLNGNVTNMGVASSTNRYFEWWQDGGVVQTTPLVSQVAIGSFSASITINPLEATHFKAVVQVGSVIVKGAEGTLPVDTGHDLTNGIIALALLAGVGFGVTIMYIGSRQKALGDKLLTVILGVIFIIVLLAVVTSIYAG